MYPFLTKLKKVIKYHPFIFVCFVFYSCENQQKSVSIGSQKWTSENLNVSTFVNGDPILEAKTNEEWIAAGKEKSAAWCYYNNDSANGKKFGKLYNWYAVSDSRGLAPKGWHIPTDEEWTKLTSAFGGDKIAGDTLKSTAGWSENGNGNNSSGFNCLPAGGRSTEGYFNFLGYSGYFWTASEYGSNYAYARLLYTNLKEVQRYKEDKNYGFAIRCVKD